MQRNLKKAFTVIFEGTSEAFIDHFAAQKSIPFKFRGNSIKDETASVTKTQFMEIVPELDADATDDKAKFTGRVAVIITNTEK